MIRIYEIAVSGFWQFIACISLIYLLLYFPSNLILQIIHKLIRAKTISKQGYPPLHCDGDGDSYNKSSTTPKH